MSWKRLALCVAVFALLLTQSGCSREYALAALNGFERGATAPRTFSNHSSIYRAPSGRVYRTSTMCSSTMYGGSCATVTK